MASGTFIKFHHRIDIYAKTTTINAAGQKAVAFAYSKTIPVFAQWVQSDIVNQPYLADLQQLDIFVPKNNVGDVTFDIRCKDIKDRYGNLIDGAYYEVIGIQKKMQFNGKVHHSFVSLRKVVED